MRSRSKASLSARLESHLTTYAAAAGAGLLTLVQPVQAEVVYTPAHVRIGTDAREHYNLDLNHDDISDFQLINGVSSRNISLRAWGVTSSGQVQEAKFRSVYANARKVGGEIGPRKQFRQRAVMATHFTNTSGQTYEKGSWVDVQGRYLGLRFKIGGETHFGWARLNVHFEGFSLHAALTGYAYETIPNKPIVAGDEGTGASLGHLARGAAGWKSHAPATKGH